ncbi:MAG: hypothetical protein JWO67_3839 [Streptosporangiaceae bacterium]|nr:hypothetical protein [Streptosporangiaceae bacterium]
MWVVLLAAAVGVLVWSGRRIARRTRGAIVETSAARIRELETAWQFERAWRIRLQRYIAGSQRVPTGPAPSARPVVAAHAEKDVQPVDLDVPGWGVPVKTRRV